MTDRADLLSRVTLREIKGLPVKKSQWVYRSGPYWVNNPTQDQILVKFPWGRFSGTTSPLGKDSQSDNFIGSTEVRDAIPLQEILDKALFAYWRSEESQVLDEPTGPSTIEAREDQYEAQTTAETSWTPAQLALEIIESPFECDMARLRERIFLAENTRFTAEQSSHLAPWLLKFAERCRDSADPQDEAVVWSAIRTGASMLAPVAADSLRPLLEPGHSIETCLVTLKMLGRIFEAQPPTGVDQHRGLAIEVRQIAGSLLNKYAIAVSQSAAMAHLAIYALASMGSSETQQVVESVRRLDSTWFKRRMYRKLRELRVIWAARPARIADEVSRLVEHAIAALSADDPSTPEGFSANP